mmetsp:Transcript_5603/g.5795  ORF Transcript_5603/g.5795 Transcript_5603/m.5795 type:complete len:320 (-) Transcript_5603:18-977(-)|eukprot:CAMPEP_0182417370 /NCGR_PEP_ID=MMETSP1167-20130531/1822_1 /TAXON_ID=2988 /ORGANISM="Mallomonas Sp, Strain CCMP3275" /LENGTH=319 /DNA_ID=CAMNT_0024590873 /DNA_START=25 /DNA_END=984 /DNA_ORIENTATION=-
MSSKKAAVTDLDSILDQALDDFDEQELNTKVQNVAKNRDEDQPDDGTSLSSEEQRIAELENMRKLLSELDNPSFGPTLQNTLKSLSTTSEGNANVDSLFEQLGTDFRSAGIPSVVPSDSSEPEIMNADREMMGTLHMLGAAQEGMEGMEASRLEDTGETMMQDMMGQFEALGEKEDYNEVIDGVMRQLLSRDLMYEPVKQVCGKFPEWLAVHRPHLSEKEYTDYGKQYQTFQKILAVYDTEPENFPRLMELMFEMQEYGQPPADIIKGLAPGLQFDENGMPIMPNMGAGMMPEMPGGGGPLPNMAEVAGAMEEGKCCMM